MSTHTGSTEPAGQLPLPRPHGWHAGPGLMGKLKTLWERIQEHDFLGLSAEMAYNWMLALVPLLIFLFSVFGLITGEGLGFQNLMNSLRRLIPAQAYSLVEATLRDLTASSSGELAILSLLGVLWTSSNGAMVVIKALNRAYRCEPDTRNMFLQRLVAMAIVVGMSLILLVCSNLVVFGGMMIGAVEYYLVPDGLMVRMLEVLRWLLPLMTLGLVSVFIYAIAPNRKITRSFWHEAWPGALTFVTLWVLISWGFSMYVTHMANYSKVYGPMGAIIILLFWLYLSSFALLVGGQVNALRSRCDARA